MFNKVEHLIKTLVTKKIPTSDGFNGKILQTIGSILHKLAQRKDKNLRDKRQKLIINLITTRRNIDFLIRKHIHSKSDIVMKRFEKEQTKKKV